MNTLFATRGHDGSSGPAVRTLSNPAVLLHSQLLVCIHVPSILQSEFADQHTWGSGLAPHARAWLPAALLGT